jgi:hypothetical protein
MSVEGIHAITSKFKERWLNPLQFSGQRTVESRLSDLEKAKNGQQPSNPRRKIRVRGQKSATQTPAPQASAPAQQAIKRVGEDHSSDLDNWHAQHSNAASDLLHTFNSRMSGIQGQQKPSTTGGWGAFNDSFSRPSTTPLPSAPSAAPAHAPKPQRVTQPGLFGPSQVAPVRSPQQFGLAAKAAPGKASPTAGRKPRVTQPGLFPKSAVKPPQ